MDSNSLTEVNVKTIKVDIIKPQAAENILKSIPMISPPILRTNYNKKIHPNQVIFAASIKDEYVGLLASESVNAQNVHINYLAVKHTHLLQTVGFKLLSAIENYCYKNGYSSITAETDHANNDAKQISSYFLYEELGYKPLFEILSADTNQLMICLQKTLSLNNFCFIDLTHSLSADVPHWGIDVGFKYNARNIESKESASGVKFRVQRLEMSSGIGTHMDAPSHCFEKGMAIDQIPLQSLISVCRVIDVSSKAHDNYAVTTEDILQFEDEYGMIPKGAFVIIYTGWDQRWTQPEKYRNEKIFPHISIHAAEILLARDIVGLGIDTLSPDAFGSDFPVHQLILGAGKYIIENVANAKQLDPIGNYIFALPMKIADGTEAPMRLIGMKRNLSLKSKDTTYAI